MHFMMEVVYVSKLMKINPFDQPGVEAYKQELKQLL